MTRIALISGGAGAIALEIARRLAARGFDLILADVDKERLDKALVGLPASTRTVVADLAVIEGIEQLARQIESGQFKVDLLVNCAGHVQPGSIASLDPKSLYRQINVNLVAPMRLIQAVSQPMVARGSGQILTIVSAAALVALPGNAAYSASKFGLRGFLVSAHLELADQGIILAGIFPGAVDTPMLRYEATHGGSALNFMNKEVLSAGEVADAALAALDARRLETFLPWTDGILGKIFVNSPGLLRKLLPGFQKKGEAGRARFIASRNLFPS